MRIAVMGRRLAAAGELAHCLRLAIQTLRVVPASKQLNSHENQPGGAMREANARNWDDLHARMLRNEGLGGALTLAFQVLVVAGLFLG
jgi:hypothetical protein